MKTRTFQGLAVIAPALALAGCASALHPIVHQSAALPAGPRTVALASAPPDVAATSLPDRAAIERALRQAGFALRPSPAQARYRLVITIAGGPRRLGSLVPPTEGAPAMPVQWIAQPPHGLQASFGPANPIRVSAIMIEGATGRELWRATLSAPRSKHPDQVTSLATRVLEELPRSAPGQVEGGG